LATRNEVKRKQCGITKMPFIFQINEFEWLGIRGVWSSN